MSTATASAAPCVENRQLVQDIIDGVDGAFDALYEQYNGKLIAILRKRGVSVRDAEDVVQETFLRVSQLIDQLDPERSIGGFLKTIAVRIATDNHRRISRRGHHVSFDLQHDKPASNETVEEAAGQSQQFSLAMTILDEQPELTKQIVRMYFFENMTYLQIADQLGIGVTTAKDRVRKAIGAVQERVTVECCE